MKFEITFEDGKKYQITASNFAEAIETANITVCPVTKIEKIDKRELLKNIREVNESFHNAGRGYWEPRNIRVFMAKCLEQYGFSTPEDWDNRAFVGDSGEMRCEPIGKNVFLCVTWYLMPSGRYEVVAYIS